MTTINNRMFIALAMGILAATGVFAQAQKHAGDPTVAEKYIISAVAGGVNVVEGSVTVNHLNGRSGLLIKGDHVQVGERVSTGADGRAEILLNPGSYMRLGPNSIFQFRTTSLDDLQISIVRGSAMFEVFAADQFTVSLFTPEGRVVLVDTGVYRVDIASDGSGTLAVIEGKADVGLPKLIKGGRTAAIGDPAAVASKFDRGKRDELAEWSRTRAKDLAKMTSSLRNDDVRLSLMNGFNMGRWGMYSSFGLWIFNPGFGGYCFMPFGYDWYSPYGYPYRTGLYWYRLPPVIYNPPVGTGGGPIYPNPPTKTVRMPKGYDDTPPFIAIERVKPRITGTEGMPDSTMPSRMPSSFPNTSTTTSIPTKSVPVTATVPAGALDNP